MWVLTTDDSENYIYRNYKTLFDKTIISCIGLCNPQCPRTYGDGQVHQSHLDAFVYIDHPLPVARTKEPSKEDTIIGNLIAENLVDHGATLQMGNESLIFPCFLPGILRYISKCLTIDLYMNLVENVPLHLGR